MPLPHIYLAPSTPARFPEKLTDATSSVTVQTAPRKWSKPPARPARGPFVPAPGDASLPGRLAPPWADCVCGDPTQAAPAPGGPPCPGRVLDGVLFSSGPSPGGRQTSRSSRTSPCSDFLQTLVLSRDLLGSHKPAPHESALRPPESPGNRSSRVPSATMGRG